MKRIIALFICSALLLTCFCACSGKKDEDINYVISLECSENQMWECSASQEGIVTISDSRSLSGENATCVYILESVGEGETELTFSLKDKDSTDVIREVIYKVSVDSDFKITATVVLDKIKEEKNEEVKIESAGDAEKYVQDKLSENDSSNAGKYFFETERTEDGNFRVRVFTLAQAADGTTVMRYYTTYIVSPDGEMTEEKEEDVEDRPVISK